MDFPPGSALATIFLVICIFVFVQKNMAPNLFWRIPDPEPPSPLGPLNFLVAEDTVVEDFTEELQLELENIPLSLGEIIGTEWDSATDPPIEFSSPPASPEEMALVDFFPVEDDLETPIPTGDAISAVEDQFLSFNIGFEGGPVHHFSFEVCKIVADRGGESLYLEEVALLSFHSGEGQELQ